MVLLKYSVIYSLVLGLIFIENLPVAAKQMVKNFAMVMVDEGIEQTWSCSQVIKSGNFTDIDIKLAESGVILSSTITHSSNNKQYDAECLECVCALSPVAGGTPSNYTVRFGHAPQVEGVICEETQAPDRAPKYFGMDLKNYERKLTQLPEPADSVVLHKIPIVALLRQPDLFKSEEIFSDNNLLQFFDRDKKVGGLSEETCRAVSTYYLFLSKVLAEKNLSRVSLDTQADELFLKVIKTEVVSPAVPPGSKKN